jgi:UDP-N-acetylglucosamine 2-epimerase
MKLTRKNICDELSQLVESEKTRNAQRQELSKLKDLLGGGTATSRVVEVVKGYLC